MDINIGEIVIYAIITWIVLQVVLGIIDGWQMVALKQRIELIKEISDLIHDVKVEKIGDVEYWFDSQSDQFLGQGKTIDDIIAHVKSRFPDHIFLIQDTGGVSKQTDWKLMPTDEFKKVTLNTKDL